MISEASLYALGEYFLLSRLSGEVLIFKFKGLPFEGEFLEE